MKAMNEDAGALVLLLGGMRGLMDTIWKIHVASRTVTIYHDDVLSDYQNVSMDYMDLIRLFHQRYLYKEDRERWLKEFSWETIEAFLASPETRKRLELRLEGEPFGFEWHEVVLCKIPDRSGGPVNLYFFTRNIATAKRSAIIESAVNSEYDYVVYLEADRNSYIMYRQLCVRYASAPPRGP